MNFLKAFLEMRDYKERINDWGSNSVNGWLIGLAEIANRVQRANLEGISLSG